MDFALINTHTCTHTHTHAHTHTRTHTCIHTPRCFSVYAKKLGGKNSYGNLVGSHLMTHPHSLSLSHSPSSLPLSLTESHTIYTLFSPSLYFSLLPSLPPSRARARARSLSLSFSDDKPFHLGHYRSNRQLRNRSQGRECPTKLPKKTDLNA